MTKSLSLAFVFAALTFTAGCRSDNLDTAQSFSEGAAPEEGGGPAVGEQPEAISCSTDEDCAVDCPDEFLDCACETNPEGEQMCVPVCDGDGDCPDGTSCLTDEGFCVPDEGP